MAEEREAKESGGLKWIGAITGLVLAVGGLLTAAAQMGLFAKAPENAAGAASGAAGGGGDVADADVVIDTDGTSGTRDCMGGDAAVTSDKATVTLQNCPEVRIIGDDNRITIAGAVASIALDGDRNDVAWAAGAGGGSPVVADEGDDNKVYKGH